MALPSWERKIDARLRDLPAAEEPQELTELEALAVQGGDTPVIHGVPYDRLDVAWDTLPKRIKRRVIVIVTPPAG